MIDYRFAKDITLESAADIFCQEYKNNADFKEAAVASVLSAMKELRGSHDDRHVAELITDRLFLD